MRKMNCFYCGNSVREEQSRMLSTMTVLQWTQSFMPHLFETLHWLDAFLKFAAIMLELIGARIPSHVNNWLPWSGCHWSGVSVVSSSSS